MDMSKRLAGRRGLIEGDAMTASRLILALLIAFGLATTARAQAPDDPCWVELDAFSDAAVANGQSVLNLEWTPFAAVETGWETYAPLIQQELATACSPGSPGFASALAAFQTRYELAPTGVFDAATFQVFKGVWQERRPFVMARVAGECPEPPPINTWAYLLPEEEHADRITRMLRRDVLEAYRRMAAAARAEVPEIAANPELLQFFSGLRDPAADAARCAAEGNCDGLRRAVCSPHRTGTAIDISVGHAFGFGVDSTDAYNRLQQSRGATYRWLAANARRFGFVPYVYEPWHWEWVGP